MPSAAGRWPRSAATAADGRGVATAGGAGSARRPRRSQSLGHAGERPHRGLRKRIARDPRLLERAHARRDARAADEGAGDRDAPAPRRADHRPRHPGGVRRRLGREQHERGIRRRAADGVERMAVARGVGVAHEVDGIGEARRRRQHGGEPLAHRRVERLDREARIPRGVGRDDAEPAPIGHHEEPAAARQRLAREPARDVEELLDGAHAQRSRLLDRRVERAIGARQRAGVRRRRRARPRRSAPPSAAPPASPPPPRAAPRRSAARPPRPRGSAAMTRVSASAATASSTSASVMSAWLPRLAKSEKPMRRSRAQSRMATASAPECETKAMPPGSGMPGANVTLSRARRPDPAEAVRPEDADRLVAEPLAQLGLARAPLLARFPEARGDHHRAGHALGRALHRARAARPARAR